MLEKKFDGNSDAVVELDNLNSKQTNKEDFNSGMMNKELRNKEMSLQ